MNKNGFDSTQRETASKKVARDAVAQSIVLLKNENNTLPLLNKDKVNIAVFGLGQIYTIKGGTGSGNVYNLGTVNILEGLNNCPKLNVDKELSQKYESWALNHESKAVEGFLKPKAYCNPEMPIDDIDLKVLAKRNDAAIIVISRLSGEGADRSLVKGDYYLQDSEQEIINKVSAEFNKVILVLNVAGIIDTKFIDDKIQAVINLSLPGQEGGNALAEVLTGKVNPSAKLTDTWAINYQDYITSKNFGLNSKNGNKYTNIHNKSFEQYEVTYEEGVYVGYRYFDTFGKEVAYPFGYGLSYTNFEISNFAVKADGQKINVKATAQNTGNYSGKEVVQVYISKPDGDIEKPYQELVGFSKTADIAKGEKADINIDIDLNSLSSYDENKEAYVIEKGYYYIRVGNSSRNTKVVGAIYIDKTIETEKLKNNFKAKKINELSKKGAVPITYATELEEIKNAKENAIKIDTDNLKTYVVDYSNYKEDPDELVLEKEYMFEDVIKGNCTVKQFTARLSIEELAKIVCGTKDMPDLEEREKNEGTPFQFDELEKNIVDGSAGQSTGALKEAYGIPQIVLADGPAGVRITQSVSENGKAYSQNCTAFPVGTMLASSWDKELIKKVGEIIGIEMLEYDVDLWLAPGMNIHRNPLCGRNFEYYSEDPFVSGAVATAITDGVQSKNVGVTIKHFAANNMEDERMNCNNVISERALREIYLKGFEIAIKNSKPWSIMTSYNDINGVPSADNFSLCTLAARAEWGFDGFIMTDWGGGISNPALSMYAGNDMIQPGGRKSIKALIDAYESKDMIVSRGEAKVSKVLTKAMLQKSAFNILNIILKREKAR